METPECVKLRYQTEEELIEKIKKRLMSKYDSVEKVEDIIKLLLGETDTPPKRRYATGGDI